MFHEIAWKKIKKKCNHQRGNHIFLKILKILQKKAFKTKKSTNTFYKMVEKANEKTTDIIRMFCYQL